MMLTDEVVEALAGGDAQKKALDDIAASQVLQEKISGVMRGYSQAKAKNDAEGIAKAISEIKELDAGSSYLPMMNFGISSSPKRTGLPPRARSGPCPNRAA